MFWRTEHAIGERFGNLGAIRRGSSGAALLGSTPKDKALVAMWERRAEIEGFAAVFFYFCSVPSWKGFANPPPRRVNGSKAAADCRTATTMSQIPR